MPNLARIRDAGAYLPCASTVPPATFPAWTTCVTGVNPGRHGIVDFTRMKDGEYGIEFVNASFRQAPALWNVLSEAGKRVCVLGVPGTYPPDEVNGVMVSGFDSPVSTGIDSSFVYPESMYSTVRDWRFADFKETNIGQGWHDAALEKLLEGIAAKEVIAVDLMKREPWDFFMLVFGESDTVSHHFWMFHDPDSPRHRPGHENAIRSVYERLDEAVGKLVGAMGEDVCVGVVSDHGFGGSGTGVVHLNNWLAENGYLTFGRTRDSVLKKLALRLTPARWQGALFRKFRGLASSAESRSRFAGIDWAGTTAWSEELNYFPSIRVNVQGQFPEGQVASSDYDRFCTELCAKLESWEPIRKAWRREELYDGPFVGHAPDIVLELALENGYSHSCLRSRGGPAFRRLAPDEYMGGKERGMNGNHRPTGIFLLSEPVQAKETYLLDIVPTVYHAMGIPASPTEGQSLLGSNSHGRDQRQREGEAPAEPHVYTPEQEAVIENRLRNLGYFE